MGGKIGGGVGKNSEEEVKGVYKFMLFFLS